MYNSILQLALELTEKICKRAEEGEIKDIDVMASHVADDCRKTSAEIVQAITKMMNENIRQDKETRKELGLVIKESDRSRQIFTALGMLDIERDYFYDRINRRHVALLDQLIGLDRYERVGGTVKADLAKRAADVSYAKSADIVTRGEISRQTVRNCILEAEVPEIEPREERKAVEELHVYADEDHAHMQKEHKERGKKSRIVPLVTVTEGTEKITDRRSRTIEPMHFVDENFDTKELWKTVEGYIDKAYDVTGIKKICVHGDGGQWIRSGLTDFSQTEHIMDGYHFFKELKKVSRILPNRNVRQAIVSSLEKDDHRRADRFIQDLLEEPITGNERQTICGFATYLFGNWDEIRRRITEQVPGSCTESQVSHVLSERFSRDPVGWSDEGLGKLTTIRVYLKNGGELTKDMFRKKSVKYERYSEYADRFIEDNLEGAIDFSIFEPEKLIFDVASGTQKAIRGLGLLRDISIQ